MFIDAHHHLWDLHHCHYPWLMARGERRFFGDPTPIQRNYLPAEFAAESADYKPVKSVHIQVGVRTEDETRETAWLQSLAPYPQAIVAATDLRAPDLPASLDAHAAHERFRGVRQIVGRHIAEDRKHGSDELLDDPAFVAGLRELATRGLSFDLQMIPPQMPRVLAALQQVPELRVVLCHCGSPWDQSPDGLADWGKGLRALAARPNTWCKVSGLGMFNPQWTDAALAPLITEVVDIFGPGRVMFGSNFPVDKLYNSYEALWRCYNAATSQYTATEREQMFYHTAADFYGI
ncbi:amidohydrolase family protein [Pseudohalioglobus sediminis]|uniref:Amidohydrolase family protein n=2 Tax=Pseudohalioglobus sediminis TaxID=2606449 RepID=A0A5B0WQV6_9GAMM|nr:amidohydrolase family protein [Pseudohalioglobus sediminis]